VKGVTLKCDDELIALSVVRGGSDTDLEFLVLTENGYGKKTPLSEYKTQGRGGSGIKTLNVTDKTGRLVGAKVITLDHKEIMAMSQKSQVIRTSLESVPSLGRATQGVRIMKLRSGDVVASLTVV